MPTYPCNLQSDPVRVITSYSVHHINGSHLEQKHKIKILTHALFGLPYRNILTKFNLNHPETCFAVILWFKLMEDIKQDLTLLAEKHFIGSLIYNSLLCKKLFF